VHVDVVIAAMHRQIAQLQSAGRVRIHQDPVCVLAGRHVADKATVPRRRGSLELADVDAGAGAGGIDNVVLDRAAHRAAETDPNAYSVVPAGTVHRVVRDEGAGRDAHEDAVADVAEAVELHPGRLRTVEDVDVPAAVGDHIAGPARRKCSRFRPNGLREC
jgi:hypothetical protein